ncbi:SusC/RagA family TonB-linked outer membrane protein [Bacteroides sp. AN502(2024)]|uniref:SusC/RagA family TonB-linked outer membrane protein n=1 Tax=Bacteroides sp. AN502(2024) TaxID=3160599 RepID=UPI003513002E
MRKKRVISMKIPCRIWLLAATLSIGQTAFSLGVESVPMNEELAQQRKVIEVSGTVTDSSGPVIGATVAVKGTSTGVITDIDGNFKLKVPVGATITVSYIGYQSKEIQYKGERNLKIQLNENVQELQEVQVIAYGSQKKVTVTGALSSINNEELLKSPVASMANALTGKVTGLASVQSSGQPGADDATLYVRGVGSLSTDLSQPLMLVDGVERSFFQLDPNEVESITVLKDASATAVFGVRGANGVILVTTKRGTQGKAKVNFSTTFAWQMPSRVPEFAGSYDYATAYNNAQLHDGVAESQLAFSPEIVEKFRTNSDPLVYPSTNWTDMLIKNSALQTQHNFNISGGSERVKYFASLGVFTQNGLFNTFEENGNDKGFKYNRYNYRINMDVDVTKTTSMQVNLGGYLNDKQEPNYNNGTYTNLAYLFRDVYTAVPFAGAGVVDGKWVISDQDLFSVGNYADGLNVYYGKGYNNRTQNTLNFDFKLEQKLDFLTKGLKAHVKGAYNSGVTITKRREGRANRYEAVYDTDGKLIYRKTQDYQKLDYKESTGQSRNWYLEAALNYKRDFGHHHVSALAMYNQSMTYYPFEGKSPSEFIGIPRSYVGLVGRATYDYKTRYLLDVSVGYNGSENFAEGQRFGLFPAGSLGWIISEEKFFQPVKKFVTYLKFRGSYGIVGNDRVSDYSRFLYLPDKYLVSSGNYSFGTNTSTLIAGATESKKGNPKVTWETSEKQNYGIDAKFLKDRLSVNFDYFIEHRKNILKSRTISPGYLAVSLPIANIGKVDNKGYEINVKWDDRINEVRYYVGANLSYAKNKVVFIDEIRYPYEWMQTEGKPVGQQFGYVFDGYFTEEEAANYESLKGKEGGIADQGSGYIPLAGDVKYKDLNDDGRIDEKDVRDIGYPKYPLYTAGVNMGLSWKGFDFSMTWAGAFKTSRLLSSMYRIPYGESNNSAIMKYMIEDAWTPEKGDAAKAPALSFRSKSHNYQDSDLWLRDASYVRLKNIELGYSFPSALLKKAHIGSLRIFLSGYNLLTFDNFKVSDPESDPSGSTYPLIKVVNVGLKVGF